MKIVSKRARLYFSVVRRHPSLVLYSLRHPSLRQVSEEAYKFILTEPIMRKMKALSIQKASTFSFNGKEYNYFYHDYNDTWCNERSVEVPIIKRIVDEAEGEVLEVGNVLPHYFPSNHRVVDKYEKAPGVTNEDIVSFDSNSKFDLIVSISTFEHIGWDERPRNPSKLRDALGNVRKLLDKDGEAWLTLPYGQNEWLDKSIVSDELELDESYCMKRTGLDNSWIQCTLDDALLKRHVSPVEWKPSLDSYPYANAIIIAGILK
jgi:hypothetical protein